MASIYNVLMIHLKRQRIILHNFGSEQLNNHTVFEKGDYLYVNHHTSFSTVQVNNNGEASNFRLIHKTKSNKDLSIVMWTSEYCGVQLAKLNFSYSHLVKNQKIAMKKKKKRETFKLTGL